MPNGREKKRKGGCCKQQVVACSQVGGVGSVLAGLIRMLGQRLRSIPQMRTIREVPSGAKHVQFFVPFASAQRRQLLQNMASPFDQGTGSTQEPPEPAFWGRTGVEQRMPECCWASPASAFTEDAGLDAGGGVFPPGSAAFVQECRSGPGWSEIRREFDKHWVSKQVVKTSRGQRVPRDTDWSVAEAGKDGNDARTWR